MLSTTCRIELIEPEGPDMSFEDALYWKSYRIRVKVTAEDDLCKRTARQMAVEIHSFKMRKERVSGPATRRRNCEILMNRKSQSPHTGKCLEFIISTKDATVRKAFRFNAPYCLTSD